MKNLSVLQESLIQEIWGAWSNNMPAPGDIDPRTNVCRCGCGKGLYKTKMAGVVNKTKR